uniref:C2H2-type domain-containing protein n=1 Tax=Anopheles atroparvus TaxID=41427 RepID=A0AAG5DFC7_ANOAO
MSSEKCETASVVGDESFGNDAVSLEADDSVDAFVLSSNSSLSSGEKTPYNRPFFIQYSYMAKLSMQDLSMGSRGPKFYCHLCEDFFHTRLSMITHMKMHGMPFCPVCFAMFPQALDV